jgi:hypothetical protein
MRLAVSVTVTQIGEDGSTRAVGGELAAALAGRVEQFTGMLTWTAEQAGAADHGDREKVIAESGLELQRWLLESTFTIDAGCEERVAAVTSAAGIRHGTVEAGHDRGVVSIFGPVRAQPWLTATVARRTCTRRTRGGRCPMTRTPSGCAP